MFLRIETLPSKKLMGKQMPMSFSQDRTGMLWGSFMPHRMKIQNKLDNNLYSMQIFKSPPSFQEDVEFVKWAVVEVSDFEVIPEGMETYELNVVCMPCSNTLGQPAPFKKPSTIFFRNGCPNRVTYLTIASILNCWEKNTRTTTRSRKRKFGYRLKLKFSENG